MRNDINASETSKHMEEAEFSEVKVTIKDSTLKIINYCCPDDKMLSLDSVHVQVSDSGFLITGDFNSHYQSWGYDNIDKQGEEIEDWQDEHERGERGGEGRER